MLAASFIRDARRSGIGADALTPVGGMRRFAPAVDRVELLAVVDPARMRRTITALSRLPAVLETAHQLPHTITLRTGRGTVTLHVSTPEDAGAALVWHTGSAAHVTELCRRAEGMGLRFENASLGRAAGTGNVPCLTEQDLYAHLALPYIAPELRNGDGEIDACANGMLPNLLSEGHIRGDLHLHSTWSDGANTIEEMVGAARQIGYEYVAITDHSERAWSSRTLAAADAAAQRDEIIGVRARTPGIDVLHGVEVDIMHDGSLDFDDDVLAGFDIVLASLHDWGGHDGARLTERYLRAMAHPLVNVITHPANRSPGLSDGYALDFDRLFAAAAATGTAMEIDGAPGHLDMDGGLARRAAAAGVTIAVDSDCHRADAMARQMRFGVGTARRGWIEPHQVLNTRPVGDIFAFVARKRTRQ